MVEAEEAIVNVLEKCPICQSSEGFKISGFLEKTIECNHCKAKWVGGVDPDGEQWLRLKKSSNNRIGDYPVKSNRSFPLKFWLKSQNISGF